MKVQIVSLCMALLLVSKTFSADTLTDEKISAGFACEGQYAIFLKHIQNSKERVKNLELFFEYIKLCKDEAPSEGKKTCKITPKLEKVKAEIASDMETHEQFKLLEEKCKGVSKETLDEVGLLIEEERIQEQENTVEQQKPSNNLKMGRQLKLGKNLKRLGKAVKNIFLSTICLGSSPLWWTIVYFKAIYDMSRPVGDEEDFRLIVVPLIVVFGIPVVPIGTVVCCIKDKYRTKMFNYIFNKD